MRLAPLGAADDAELLGAPRGEDEGAVGRKARTGRLRERARALEQHDGAGERIGRAEPPRIVVAADDHPLVRMHAARDEADDVRRGPQIAVLFDLHPHAQRVAALEPVRERDATRPARVLGHLGARHATHDLGGGRVADRLHRDARNARALERAPCGTVHRGSHRGGWVAWLVVRKHRAALDARLVGPAALGPHGALGGPGVRRVGVDEKRRRAGFLGELGLEATEVPAVAREHDLAPAVDAERAQALEVGLRAVVGVHDAGRDVAAGAVRVPSEREPRVRGGGILRKVALGDRKADHAAAATRAGRRNGRRIGGLHDLDQRGPGLRQRGDEVLDDRAEPHGDERVANPANGPLVGLGAGNVRLGPEQVVP